MKTDTKEIIFNPKPIRGHIWECKSSYTRSDGEEINGPEGICVLVITDPMKVGNEDIIRVWPISKELSESGPDDHIIQDISILEFEFFVETWNEQPITTGVLKKLLGVFDISVIDDRSDLETFEASSQIREFRKKEIVKTSFLRESVMPLLEKKKEEAKIIPINYKAVMAIAASLIGIIMIIWQPGRLSNTELYSKNFQPFPNKFGEVRISEGPLRGEECNIPYFSAKECKDAKKGLLYYEAGNFEESVEILEPLLEPKKKNPELLFYLAIAQLEQRKYNSAIENFRYLSKEPEFEFKEDAEFYLGLSYLSAGKRGKAKSQFKKIHKGKGKYSRKADDIISNMRWF